jgi:hypothetical protein
MSIVDMPWKLTFLASLVLASVGCSASAGSTPGAGGNNAGAGGSTSGLGTGGSAGNDNLGGTAGNGGNVSGDYSPVSATTSGSQQYTLQMGPIKLVIDGAKGARITEFSYNGSNIFTGPDVNAINYGSTFWPSPQSSWYAINTWPPIEALDTDVYTGTIDSANNSIQLTSGTATLGKTANSQFTVTKQFTPVPASGAIDIKYTITNVSSSVSITVAPWEVSRVKRAGGLTFFGKGTNSPTFASGTDTANFVVTEANGIFWYKHATVTANSKCFSDGAGWIAHVTADNILFLLTYPDITPDQAASGEAEVELYTSKTDGDYVEVEPQGASTTIAPGATLQWTVRWKLRQVPSGTTVDVGSAELATFTAQQKSQ